VLSLHPSVALRTLLQYTLLLIDTALSPDPFLAFVPTTLNVNDLLLLPKIEGKPLKGEKEWKCESL